MESRRVVWAAHGTKHILKKPLVSALKYGALTAPSTKKKNYRAYIFQGTSYIKVENYRGPFINQLHDVSYHFIASLCNNDMVQLPLAIFGCGHAPFFCWLK